MLDNWFSKKAPDKVALPPESTGAGEMDVHTPASTPNHNAAQRRSVRLERRELLYGVIRESMIHAGVLSSSYKFKVLSLDAQGLQYLVMVDLVQGVAGDMGRLAEIEAHIAHGAKIRHDILVTAVYWRVSEPMNDGLLRKSHTATGTAPAVDAITGTLETGQHAATVGGKSEPIKGLRAQKMQKNDAMAHTEARKPRAPAGFADTEVATMDERLSPLSGTQYGDLK